MEFMICQIMFHKYKLILPTTLLIYDSWIYFVYFDQQYILKTVESALHS